MISYTRHQIDSIKGQQDGSMGKVAVWRSEDNLYPSLLSYYVSPED